TIYHNNPFIFYRDLNEPLISIDDLRADYNDLRADYNDLRADYNDLRADYDRLLQNASPLLELSQNTTFKIYYKIYQKSLPLLRAARKLIKK
ncbi:fucosyltransferase, partial [Helicobacter pylori]|nr:fucosyltransferase [Helicobacter pylori]MBH0286531.1 fucosyltransferase [Helicobacter pylori]MBH0289661.1 fucosyltransferase [Helicobacter pylori]